MSLLKLEYEQQKWHGSRRILMQFMKISLHDVCKCSDCT